MIDTVESLLQQMVAVPTVNRRPVGEPGTEGPLVDLLEPIASGMGLNVRRLPVAGEPDNLLVTHRPDADAPWLLFVSHLDTVDVVGMTVDPFAGEIRDGRLYGRGACDTKGTGAAILWSLMQYAAQGERPNNVAVLYTVDEEIGLTGARSFAANDLPGLGWRPAGVIVGEPTDLRCVAAHNGVVRWRIRTRGVSAHSADPSAGRSAISMMAEVVRAIESRYIAHLEASHPLTGRAQCSVNLIRGGSQINIIPADCEIEIDRRIVPGEDPDRVLPDVEAVLDDLRRTDPHFEAVQDEPYIVSALDSNANAAWASHVSRVLDRLGMSPEPVGAKYGTEASRLGQAGLPAIVLGPGSAAQAHTEDEWIALDQLKLGCDVYLDIMREPIGPAGS